MSSKVSPKRAYYICGTHWDREWYEPFQEYRMWLVQNMDSLLDRLKADSRYRVFHLDGQAVVLEDYLEIRPERRGDVEGFLREGRLLAGPWYAMPDLWLVSGEALIRNFLRGMEVVRSFGSEPMRIGYCPDLFGHIASMPMIFSGLGFDGAVVWRGLNDCQVRSQFFWVGPDGSRMLTHRFPDNYGYCWFGGQLRHPWKDAAHDEKILRDNAPLVLREEAERGNVPLVYLSDGGDHQPMPERVPEMLKILGEACPDVEFIHGSMPDYFAELKSHSEKLGEYRGELRNVARVTGKWFHAMIPHCLSSRYPLKLSNDRCQNLLTLWGEPMAALAMMTGKPVVPGFLSTAWKHLLHNQPHDSIGGCSIDATHDDMPYRFHQCELLGDGVRRQAMAALVPLAVSDKALENLVLWNPLPWERAGVQEIDVLFSSNFPSKAMRSGHTFPVLNQFDLLDPEGKNVPYQVLEVEEGCTAHGTDWQGRNQVFDKPLDRYRLAVQVTLPAAGFTSLRVSPLEGDGAVCRDFGTLRTGPLCAENEFLRLTVFPSGLVELQHLPSGRTFTDLFQYEDSGDRGDGWSFIPPMRNPVLVSSGQTVGVFVEEDGPLQTTFLLERTLRIPKGLDPKNPEARSHEMIDLSVTDFLTVRAGDPLLQVRTVVENTAADHRLRVLFPSDIATAAYWSDQPFAWVERPVAIDHESATYKEPDPVERPHHTALGLADDKGGLALLCPEGLHEHSIHDDARRTIALTLFRSFHKTVRTDGEPGAQCFGTMEFHYALCAFSEALPKAEISRSVLELQTGMVRNFSETNSGQAGFLQVDSSDPVVPTAIKPAQDGKSLIVRVWNVGSEKAKARLRLRTPIASASLCNLAEEILSELPIDDQEIQVAIEAHSLTTISIVLPPSPPVS